MKRPLSVLDSLRRKIVFGYGVAAALVIGLSVYTLIDMRFLERNIQDGERITRFLDLTLEMRRFEKNYFLYRQPADRDENLRYALQAHQLLIEHNELFARFDTQGSLVGLGALLQRYQGAMASLAPEFSAPQETEIRRLGKKIVTLAETWSNAERRLLQKQLANHRHWLMASIGAVVLIVLLIGRWLAERVAFPLRQMEQRMVAVAAGQVGHLEFAVQDREIASLSEAFNRMLHELQLRQRQLVRTEKLAALGTLLSGVAHELNNPLSNISTSCEILGEELAAQMTDFERELLAQIDTETWRARRIVRSLLDYARERDFQRKTIVLAALVADSLRLIKARIPAAIDVRVDVPPSLIIEGDRQRLQQALFNLVSNAIDALDGIGELFIAARCPAPSLPVGALIFGQCPASAVEIELRDTGCGISAEVLPRIFDPFFTTKDVGHGLGLGLFIVFEIVEEHGGCIAVLSAPGHGTRFLLRLPHQAGAAR